MPDTGEALKIWQALRPMVDKEIAEQTENCVRAKKMIVKQATVQNDDGSVSLGVAEPYNDKVMIPSGDELSNVNPGSPVWVYWYFNNASTMHVALNGDGTQGSAVTDRLLEMLNNEIADREKADRELQSYIETTASHLRVEFADGLNSLRSYVELTSSALQLEFHDDLNGLRSYLEMTASHLRIEFYDDLNGLRSYLEMTASHLRVEFYDDMNSLRSYLELTASHLRAEFYDDINSLRSYLELTASHLRAEFYDDVNSLRSYLELTASHLRTEFYDDLNSMRSYLELTASHLRTEFYDDMNSLRSYVEITASHLRSEYYDDMNSMRSYIEQTASQIRMEVSEENTSLRSYIQINADKISLVVDSNNSIKAASIVAAINAQTGTSTVKISADIVDIDAATYVSFLSGQDIECAGLTVVGSASIDSLTVGNELDVSYVDADMGQFNDLTVGDLTVGDYDVADAIATLGPATSSSGQISIPYTTLGGSSGTVNFNIADTQFYIDGVAAARTAGYNEARTEWRPDNITIDGKYVTVINAAGDNVGGPYSAASIYNSGENSVYVQSWNSPTWNASGVTVSGTLSNGRTFSKFFSE